MPFSPLLYQHFCHVNINGSLEEMSEDSHMPDLHINFTREGDALVYVDFLLDLESEYPELSFPSTFRALSMLLILSFSLCMNHMFILPFQYNR